MFLLVLISQHTPPALSTCHPVIFHLESLWTSKISVASAKGAAAVAVGTVEEAEEEDIHVSRTTSMFVLLGASIFLKMVVVLF